MRTVARILYRTRNEGVLEGLDKLPMLAAPRQGVDKQFIPPFPMQRAAQAQVLKMRKCLGHREPPVIHRA